MKSLLSRVATIAKRLYRKSVDEPLAVRAAIAAAVNVAVISGLVGAPFTEEVDEVAEAALLAVANLGLLLSARAHVSPTS